MAKTERTGFISTLASAFRAAAYQRTGRNPAADDLAALGIDVNDYRRIRKR
jgi:hypothetical protein